MYPSSCFDGVEETFYTTDRVIFHKYGEYFPLKRTREGIYPSMSWDDSQVLLNQCVDCPSLEVLLVASSNRYLPE